MLSTEGLPVWFQVARLLVTFLVTAACGIHAFSSFKSNELAARRWMFFLYSVIFLFTCMGMFAYLIIAVQMKDYSRGPFSFGLFSILLILSYLALTYGVGKRKYDWNRNGQEQFI